MIPPLLRQRLFRRFWLGETVSLFGDQVTLVALPLTAVLILDAGPAQLPSPLLQLRELPETAE